jgi:putative ABC transport system permease protein
MNLWDIAWLALRDLSLHKFRSALATLGIILGVSSVVGMLSISEGARREAIEGIERLGIDNILLRSVKPSAADQSAVAGGKKRTVFEYGLLRRDRDHIRRTYDGMRWTVGVRDMRKNLYAPGGTQLDLRVMATEPEYLQITRSSIERGRFLEWLDAAEVQKVCVLGSEAARKLFAFQNPLGSWVRIGSDWFRVVGILQNRAAVKAGGGEDINRYVFIPLATAERLYGTQSIQTDAGAPGTGTRSRGPIAPIKTTRVEFDSIVIRMDDTNTVPATAARLSCYLSKTHKLRDYEIIVPMELMRQKEATLRTFAIVMAAIAGISLLVGGIGIMNIMLANVRERTREIGTRRALGARRAEIMRQFLIEAGVLTTLGGVAGVVFGYGLARIVTHYAQWPTVVTTTSLILGVGVSTAVGIASGLWPARQAAAIDPIEALRSE